jgi:hypothetical protein
MFEGMPRATDFTTNLRRRCEKLHYLTQRGSETRSWDLSEFVPAASWQRINRQLTASGCDLSESRRVSLIQGPPYRGQGSAFGRPVGSPPAGGAALSTATETTPPPKVDDDVRRLTHGIARDVDAASTTTAIDEREGPPSREQTQRPSQGARTPIPARLCDGCGISFVPRNQFQRHHTPACRAIASRRRQADRISDLSDQVGGVLDVLSSCLEQPCDTCNTSAKLIEMFATLNDVVTALKHEVGPGQG